jgi:hypothetical protein
MRNELRVEWKAGSMEGCVSDGRDEDRVQDCDSEDAVIAILLAKLVLCISHRQGTRATHGLSNYAIRITPPAYFVLDRNFERSRGGGEGDWVLLHTRWWIRIRRRVPEGSEGGERKQVIVECVHWMFMSDSVVVVVAIMVGAMVRWVYARERGGKLEGFTRGGDVDGGGCGESEKLLPDPSKAPFILEGHNSKSETIR